MYGDGDDGGTYIWSGWGFVNRIGYLISEKPVPENTTIQIKMSEYWYYCEGCGTEIEDEGQKINDKFYEFACCPQCATAEQLKEIEEANA
jgi:Zn finger protein HypA/HybF involved in hydrogenase expression